MNDRLNPKTMLEAARLTRAGRLAEATTLIQRMLRGEIAPDITVGADDDGASQVIDAKAIDHTNGPRGAATPTQPHSVSQPRNLLDGVKRRGFGLQGLLQDLLPDAAQPAPALTPEILPAGGEFIEATYRNSAGIRAYKLYIPSRYHGQALPLVVMLHGCTQSPDDFAAGTRMNLIAEEQTCFVAYPAQTSDANPAKCWNWFRPEDQQRDQGEPSLIAGITRHIMREYAIDPQRVYIGGLSAGAAAAAVMGATYPDLFAAIGMHSGLTCGAANNLASAFTAMRHGDLAAAFGSNDIPAMLRDGPAVPTIVFHGDRDTTVHPRNAEHIIARSMGATNLQKTEHRGRVPGGHAYTRTIHTDASGREIFEYWNVHEAGHAWSGGSPAGTYTDPLGPDATKEMLRFFLQHSLPQQPA